MSWVTIVWSMVASASLTLAAMHFLVWARRRTARAHLFFSLSAAGVAAYAACELQMMRAETPSEFGLALRWAHVPVWVIIVSLVAFARLYLGAGRLWLAWTVCGVRTLALLLNFGPAPNLNYLEISALAHRPFLGEMVAVGEGVRNPWGRLGPLNLLLLATFVVDASLAAWRRGDRRQALAVGGSMAFFAAGATIESVLVLGGIVEAPLTASLLFLGVIGVMGYQLSDDLLGAARLSDDLTEREQQIALAADAADLGLWIWSGRQDAVWATERLRPMHGLGPAEPISRDSFLEHLHPEDREPTRQALRRALQEGSDYSTEYRVIPPNGRPRWIAASGRVEKSPSDGAVRMLGVCMDITERKQAQEQFRLVVEASPSGVVLVDGQGRVVLVNAETERLFGYTRGELIGMSVETLVPERLRGDHPGHRQGFFAAPRARPMGFGRELFARRKDGTEFAVEIGLSPIAGADGPLVLAAIVDVTVRRQDEVELGRLRDNLAHAGRISLLAQLASGLAHELSQPLGAILRNAEAAELLLQVATPDLDEVRAILADVCKDDHRAGEVIDHMRALLKRRGLARARLSVAELIGEVLVLVQPDAASRKVSLGVEVQKALPPVTGDRVQLQQVLLNLIINAMDAMAEVPVEARRLVVRARQTDLGTVEMAVADAGHGVPPAKLARLFEPFATTKPDGLGLGLPISAGIVRAHGGRIWAESGPAGATFYFTVPMTEEE